MIGAPALTALAALRAGCGLARMAMPASILRAALTIAPGATGVALPQDDEGRPLPSPSAEVLGRELEGASCLAVGPGWGVGFERQQMLIWLVSQDQCPIVLDADGLNNLAQVPEFSVDLRAPLILTPHPGEYRRLAAALGIEADATRDDERPRAAEQLARRLGCVVALKGAGTVVTDGLQTWVAPHRNPVLATGGTGDVLTGVLASFVAQFWKPPLGRVTPRQQGGLDFFDIACWGVTIHARAAERWSRAHGDAGMLATDLIDAIPDTLREARASPSG